MVTMYLHDHPEFSDLIRIYASKEGINPVLVEKDYWIMHCLYGLQKQNLSFFLKGGTSLSKGYQIIDRFSEDIDILIKPPEKKEVFIGKNQNKPQHVKSRESYYDWLATEIRIDGLLSSVRDHAFDDEKFRSGGVRLHYPSSLSLSEGIKEGVLLECGFDTVSPYEKVTISSWLYDYAYKKASVIDNRAILVPCYHPGYTFVEKLQAISTKYRKQQSSARFSENFLRHYYDVYSLLKSNIVQEFIGTPAYNQHKMDRFRAADTIDIIHNEAFLMSDVVVLKSYTEQYNRSAALYYKGRPTFEEIITCLREWIPKL